MDKDKELQLFELRHRKGDFSIDFLTIKFIVEDLKKELPEKAELLDKVLDKARTLRDGARRGIDWEINEVIATL